MADKLENKFYYLDGGMGTTLQQSLLQIGEKPELLNITHPEEIIKIHKTFIEKGSDIIYSNTFGCNSHKMADAGYSVTELIQAALKNARKAVEGTSAKVALDIGPIGEMMEPSGVLSFDEAYEIIKEQVLAGKELADLVVLETMTDLYEVKAAVLAVKENCDLPLFVTMSFEENQRTFTGCSIESFGRTVEGLGVDAIGVNCSLGPIELYPIIERLSKNTTLPLIVKANAGLPDPVTNEYVLGPKDFAAAMKKIAELGVQILGGCCGTTPEYISEMIKEVKDVTFKREVPVLEAAVCTPTQFVPINDVRVIGERINPTGKKRFKQALINNEMDYIIGQAVEQVDAGAPILDVNVGLPEIDEQEFMIKTVKALQSVVDVPLQIDSSNRKAIESGLRYYNGKPILNSVNGEQESMDSILPFIKKYGACVVGLTLDENGIPQTGEGRFAIAEKILKEAMSYGIPKEDVFIDCLTLTVSAEQSSARETLKAMRLVKEKLGLKLVLGVSNISFGLPNRELINENFLVQAMQAGLDLPIINPNKDIMMDAIAAFRVLNMNDVDSEDYIARFIDQGPQEEKKSKAPGAKMTIGEAIAKGLKEDVKAMTYELLETNSEIEIIDTLLIPALDEVGKNYEKGVIFLPQLIKAATASQEAFEVIKAVIAEKGDTSISKGIIVVATVKGDIHDIGKNIVKVILENYGYNMIDLGRDVPVQTVVDAVLENKVELVGLSALMTTTLVSMEETIDAIRATGHPCKIMVGGAVLTEDYAMKIGADYYCKDANAGVAAARDVFKE